MTQEGTELTAKRIDAAHLGDELLREHLSQAAAQLPGPDYYETLRWIHDAMCPGTYLEIGVRAGASLRAAHRETSCIGVDPAPQLREALGPNVRIFEMTSERFFNEVSLREIWNQGHVDVAFIDGLHLFEQALRDFINLERYTSPQSIIMVHDCIPLNGVTSSRMRTTQFYSGDTWKLVPALTQWRPDLRMKIIAAPPTGLCLIGNCDSASTVLDRQFEEVLQDYLGLDFGSYLALRDSFPELVENKPEAVKQCIKNLLCSTGTSMPPPSRS